jgi:OOP family OmpA-OmpF porin
MNVQLSKDRASAVKAYLVGKGISEDKMSTNGYGPDKPTDTNDTAAGRANNRRVEFNLAK